MPSIHTVELDYIQQTQRYFEAIRDMDWPIWLDSGKPKQDRGRFDILSASPMIKLVGSGNDFTITRNKEQQFIEDPWLYINSELQQYASPTFSSHLPFTGGWLGSFGYDLGREIEHLENRMTDDCPLPELQLGFYDWAIIQDHHAKTSHLVGRDKEVLKQLNQKLQCALNTESPQLTPFKTDVFSSNTPEATYLTKVAAIQDYIDAGDCYQVNFAQRFTATTQGDPYSGYLALRNAMPAQFSCYFETDCGAILSLSPERFLSVSGHDVLTQPIKGTAPRHVDPQRDQELAQTLIASKKDRAENLMIVDLLRNDLSKVSASYSVKVPKLFELESYSNVHHLVSSVTSHLAEDKTCTDLLKACFPGGSITGAPKVRSMEIIEESEHARRNIYCGSIGYLSTNGNMDTSIAIRTLVCSNNIAYCWGGGGVVADSNPRSEYQESLNKVKLLMDTLTHK